MNIQEHIAGMKDEKKAFNIKERDYVGTLEVEVE
jgi:hypothetical protein